MLLNEFKNNNNNIAGIICQSSSYIKQNIITLNLE